jgi:hypothetical protein
LPWGIGVNKSAKVGSSPSIHASGYEVSGMARSSVDTVSAQGFGVHQARGRCDREKCGKSG